MSVGSLAGCSADSPRVEMSADGPATVTLVADWNDIDAAVDVGASKAEMAVVSRNKGPTWGNVGGDRERRTFVLKTVGDEPAWLEITRGPGQDATDEAVTMTLHAKVGRLEGGEPEKEQRLLRAVAHRLGQLKGRDWYPLD